MDDSIKSLLLTDGYDEYLLDQFSSLGEHELEEWLETLDLKDGQCPDTQLGPLSHRDGYITPEMVETTKPGVNNLPTFDVVSDYQLNSFPPIDPKVMEDNLAPDDKDLSHTSTSAFLLENEVNEPAELLQKEIDRKTKNKLRVREYRRKKKKETENLKLKVNKLTEENADSKEEIENLKLKVNKLTEENADSKEEIENLKLKVNKLTEENADSKEEIENLKLKVNELTEENADFKEVIVTLRKELKAAKGEAYCNKVLKTLKPTIHSLNMKEASLKTIIPMTQLKDSKKASIPAGPSCSVTSQEEVMEQIPLKPERNKNVGMDKDQPRPVEENLTSIKHMKPAWWGKKLTPRKAKWNFERELPMDLPKYQLAEGEGYDKLNINFPHLHFSDKAKTYIVQSREHGLELHRWLCTLLKTAKQEYVHSLVCRAFKPPKSKIVRETINYPPEALFETIPEVWVHLLRENPSVKNQGSHMFFLNASFDPVETPYPYKLYM